MIADTDINTILRFTSGKLEEMLDGSSGKIIEFGQDGVQFELSISSRTSFLTLSMSLNGHGEVLQYRVPVTSVTETPESYEPGGINVTARLNFYGGKNDRRVLIIYKSNGKFSADPIWDGCHADEDPPQGQP
jgi:hypothetical protein